MESVREILDRGMLRDMVRLSIEVSQLREELHEWMQRGVVCPHCGANVFEEPTNAEAGN